ncbi:MAG: hypothetical protein WA820_20295 [Bradyrhizobium sp.]
MSIIPLHLQRRFEQRWAAKFARPIASATPENIGLKWHQPLTKPGKGKGKARWVGQRV